MSRIFPYPVMTLGLFVMWIALAGATPGHTVLALIVSTGSALTLKALGEKSTRVKRVGAIVTLARVVFVDILRSNYDVARLILFGKRLDRKSGFMTVPIVHRAHEYAGNRLARLQCRPRHADHPRLRPQG
jgi:multicomponent K+:H+ antiporter subunit E